MLRGPARRAVLFGSLLPFNPFDQGGPDSPIEKDDTTQKKLSPGMDRIRKIFVVGEDGELTKELKSITAITVCGFSLGGSYSAIVNTRQSVDDFRNSNQLTRFHGHLDAKRRIHDYVFRRFMINFVRTGFKIGSFCFLYGTTTAFATAYKGRYEVSNYIIGGGLTGMVFKLNMGLKGMAAGTIIGMGFGAISGLLSHGMLYLAGLTTEDIQATQGAWLQERNRIIREKQKKAALAVAELTETERQFAEAKILEEKLQEGKT